MKAVILAAGKGTRMKELTDAVPKPMSVQKPILEHILEGICRRDTRGVHRDRPSRRDHRGIFRDGSKWGVQIATGRQVVQDGTGKAPKWPDVRWRIALHSDLRRHPEAETYPQMIDRFRAGNFSGVITVTAGKM
jgi:hypothetical protein